MSYRVFFTNRKVFESWMRARRWEKTEDAAHQDFSIEEWHNTKDKKFMSIGIGLFDDDDKLKVFSATDWKNAWIDVSPLPELGPDDNELPPF